MGEACCRGSPSAFPLLSSFVVGIAVIIGRGSPSAFPLLSFMGRVDDQGAVPWFPLGFPPAKLRL